MRVGDYKDKATALLEKYQNLPAMNAPKGEQDFDFPTNADDLPDETLDTWLVLLGGWRGWVGYTLSEVDAQIVLLEEVYSIRLGKATAAIEKTAAKKMLKESLHGQAIDEDKELAALKLEVTGLQAERVLLRGRFDFYDKLFETISRVITRRGQERIRT